MSTPFTVDAEAELRADAKIFRDLSEPHILTALFLKYLLREGELTTSDFRSCFCDGPHDGGIDAIATHDDEVTRIALVQSKRVLRFDKNDVLDAASKIARTVSDLDGGRAANYSSRVRRAYTTARNSTDNAPLDIMICTTAQPSQAVRAQIEDAVRNDDVLADFNVTVTYGDDVESAIEHVEKPKRHVEEGTLRRDPQAGLLEYIQPGQEEPKGIITNVFAESINKLYSARHDDGLFAQNLRTFIANKKVDDAISNSIRSTPADFWLKNNGITIACEHFNVDGYKIVLYNFSIINGCQTATKIGKSVIDPDFVLPCKIIRENEPQKMADLAEAANSQKPIQDRDLKSNAPEQLALKREFEKQEPKIYLGIKRGVKQFTRTQRMRRGIRDWQQLDNWTYGQLVLAFHRQKPHIAFSRRGTIFGTKETYKEVFLRADRDLATETDLLRLHDSYVQWREALLEEGTSDEEQQAIVNQGRFAIIANCGLLIKAKRQLINLDTLQNRDNWARELVRADLTGKLFPPNGVDLSEKTERDLHDLFNLLLELHQSVVGEDNVAKLYKSEDFYLGPLSKLLVFRWQKNPHARYFSEAAGAFV